MYTIEELEEIGTQLQQYIDENLETILVKLNRTNQLDDLISLIGAMDILEANKYPIIKDGKIIVLGNSEVNEDTLRMVAGKMGLDKKRFEFYLDYEASVRFDVRKTQWSDNYSAILVGPMPHSGASKGDYASVIAALEQSEGFPPVKRVGSNGLKITKSSFKDALESLIHEGLVA